MKKWAVLTVLLYAVVLLLLIVPGILIAFAGKEGMSFQTALEVFRDWFFWISFAVLVAGQALLLLLPIDISDRRLTPRRPLKLPVIVTAFFLANLFFAGFFSILCAAFKDNGFGVIDPFYDWAILKNAISQNAHEPTTDGPSGWGFWLGAIGMVVIFWCFWGMMFYRYAKDDDPNTLVKRSTRWLLRGSILELLVAVPSHIIVRRRDDCCAPMGTFWGITTGISIMLLCFGPGVFFLFAERIRRTQPEVTTPESPPTSH
jgi:hypothetical protein